MKKGRIGFPESSIIAPYFYGAPIKIQKILIKKDKNKHFREKYFSMRNERMGIQVKLNSSIVNKSLHMKLA